MEELVRPDRLGPALAAATGDPRWEEFSWTLVEGGKSNLTFFLSSAAGDVVLRRTPTGELLPKAHDMGREARVQSALRSSPVPVADIIFVDEGDVLGVPCYVMERIRGHVIRDRLPAAYDDLTTRRSLAHALIDTLADLHSVDPAGVGLSDFGRPHGFFERQVRLWTGQWKRSRTSEVPEMDELGRRLSAFSSGRPDAAILHGDFRLDNVLMDQDRPDRVAAVLDWELSALGDPLIDLALFLLFWRSDDDPVLTLIPGVSHLAGMPSRAELLERYSAVTGIDLDHVDVYLAFAHLKFAAITAGVQSRGRSGAAAGQDFGDLDDEVRGLAARGLAYI